jgi:galactose mutarotase-like enzyme
MRIHYRVLNVDRQTIWFSIGGHPAFQYPQDPSGLDYWLEFNREETADRYFLENGVQSGLTERVLSSSRVLKLTDGLFDQDALVFKNLNSSEVTLKRSSGEPVVSVSYEGFPYLGIWSKPGAPFVCIEPWFGIADRKGNPTPFEEKEGVILLAAGKSFDCEYSIRIHPY